MAFFDSDVGGVGGGMVGAIWNTSGPFSFESPLKDLLDSGNYTIQDLLVEDELLQELRGMHPQLVEFISDEQNVSTLVRYLTMEIPTFDEFISKSTTPSLSSITIQEEVEATAIDNTSPTPESPKSFIPNFDNGMTNTNTNTNTNNTTTAAATADDDGCGAPTTTTAVSGWFSEEDENHIKKLRESKNFSDEEIYNNYFIRLPYMACEVICCDIISIIDILVHGVVPSSSNDHPNITILDSMFALLHSPKPIDDRRAGYLEKIVSLLFRRFPDDMRDYLDYNEDDNDVLLSTSDEVANVRHVNGGNKLMSSFMNHLHSHSIMQILQRLLLPLRPKPNNNNNNNTNNNNNSYEMGGGSQTWNNTLSNYPDDDDDNVDDDDYENNLSAIGFIRCNWNESKEAIHLLIDQLIGNNNNNSTIQCIEEEEEEVRMNRSENACEILMTIIQNSQLNSATMKILTSSPSLDKIITGICADPHLLDTNNNNHMQIPDQFSMHESTLTTSMSVLESLVLQLGGYGAVPSNNNPNETNNEEDDKEDPQNKTKITTISTTYTNSSPNCNNNNNDDSNNNASSSADDTKNDTKEDNDNKSNLNVTNGDEPVVADADVQEEEEGNDDDREKVANADTLIDNFPILLLKLGCFLRHSDTETWYSPVQYSDSPRLILGTSRLRIVRLLESFVLLGNPQMDKLLCESNVLEICLDLFWQFPWCSMLHQSVANLLVHILEGGNERSNLQHYFIVRCQLLEQLMSSFFVDQSSSTKSSSKYSELLLAMNRYNDNKDSNNNNNNNNTNNNDSDNHNCTSSVEAERGSEESLSTSSKEDLIPVSDDDVDAAIEHQQETEAALLRNEKEGLLPTTAVVDGQLLDDHNDSLSQMENHPAEEETTITTTKLINPSTLSEASTLPPQRETFVSRPGYMGHVIIICQALVHACDITEDQNQKNNDDHIVEAKICRNDNHQKGFEDLEMQVGKHNEEKTTIDNNDNVLLLNASSSVDANVSNHSKTSEGEQEEHFPKIGIRNIVSSLPIYSIWQLFVTTALATETAIQSVPLGGYNNNNFNESMNNLHSQYDNNYAMEMADHYSNKNNSDDVSNNSAGLTQYGVGGAIDLDDAELEMAASMMKSLSLPPNIMDNTNNDESSENNHHPGGHYRNRRVMGGEGGIIMGSDFGTVVSQMKSGPGEYFYDDPLGSGNNAQFDSDDEDDDDSDSNNNQDDDDDDVPVMDLFAGNFDFHNSDNHHPSHKDNKMNEFPMDDFSDKGKQQDNEEGWADFANFDDAFADQSSCRNDDDFTHPTTESDFVAQFDENDTDDDLFAAANASEIIDASTDLFGTADTMTTDDLFGSTQSDNNKNQETNTNNNNFDNGFETINNTEKSKTESQTDLSSKKMGSDQ